MKMKNRLTGIPSHIGHHSISGLAQALVGPDFLTYHEEVRKQVAILSRHVLQRLHVALRYHKHMNRRLWIDVMKSQDAVVLKRDFRRNGSVYDTTENAGVQLAPPSDVTALNPDFPNRLASSWYTSPSVMS